MKSKVKPGKNTSRSRLRSAITHAQRFLTVHTFAAAIAVGLCVIALSVLWGWYGDQLVRLNPQHLTRYTGEPHNPLKFMASWDALVYLQIAKHGYTNVAEANFFPLYPVLVGVVNGLVKSVLDSGLLVSWASFVGAIYFYLKIIKRLFNVEGNAEAIRGVLFFVFFPTAIFLIAPFTEGLFAFLALGSLYFALEKRFLPTAIFAMLCTATHVNGAAVLLLITLVLLEQRERLRNATLTIIVGSLGLVMYMMALAGRYGQPFLFIKTQTTQHGWLHGGYGNILPTMNLFNFIFVVGLILSAIYWWPRRKSFAVYSLTFLCIPLVGRQFGGFNRYMLMAFPVQLMLYGYLRNRKLAYACAMVLLGISWAYFTLRYTSGYLGG